MPLSSGSKLGPYEIQSPLGAGGMGEVYRARDIRLDRTVAVKILPEHLSSPEARQRFDREARAISSLSHPNVCHLYDVGTQEGTSYLVMDYLEGETLADRLRKGPLPLDQVLKTGMQICEGLEAAHKNGVVHRDLKPGNIMLTKSGAKLMDFGLAKPVAASTAASGLTQTLTTPHHPVTMEGMVVGTFQYMSPEQVEGKEADARSDIFALGAVLHEMATGKRAFEGKTTASTIAAILAAEPVSISSLQPLSPALLEGTIKACLAKDAEERIQTAHEVKLRLQWIGQSGAASGTVVGAIPVAPSRRSAWWVSALLALALIAGGALWWSSLHRAEPAMYFSSPMALAANDLALSADGKTVAMVAFSEPANKYMIWTYQIGARGAVVVPGTEEASHPFWSGDDKSIGFFAQSKLKTVEAFTGRPPRVLADAPYGRGAAWSKEGTIVYTPDVRAGIYRIPAAGGTPRQITNPDMSQMEQSHRWPVFLPDQHHFLYLAANFGGGVENDRLMVGSIDSDEKHALLKASSNAAYAEPGYLLYWQDNALVAQPFDEKTFALKGQARAIFEGVQYFPATQLAVFAVSGPGTLVAQTGRGVDKSQLAWFDRSGKRLGDLGPPGHYGNPALSPDGRRLAFEQTEPDGRHVDIWIRDLGGDAAARITFNQGLNEQAVWSRDGKKLAFSNNADAGWGLSQKNADGSGDEQRVLPPPGGRIMFWDWAPDGKSRLVGKDEGLFNLLESKTELTPLLQTNGTVRNAQFSPDGKWFAYSSNETGAWEIYVSPFPAVGSKWLVSRGGGTEPRWRRDGKEMFYLSNDGKITAVPIKLGATFESGAPVPLFQPRLRQPISALDLSSYDVSADGQKFLINTKVDAPSAAPLSIILNWQKEIE